MRKSLITIAGALTAGVAVCGTSTYSFSGFENAAQNDFPVPLVLREGMNGFSYSGSVTEDGSDLVVHDTDGTTVLPYEIENWDPTGESIVWVKVPTFSKATVLHLSWGESASSSQNIWGNANAVFHLTGAQERDSSAYNASVTATSGLPAFGAIGCARKIGQFADRVAIRPTKQQMGEITDTFTISFWIRSRDLASNQYVSCLASTAQFASQFALVLGYLGKGMISIFDNQGVRTGTSLHQAQYAITLPDSEWHYCAFVVDGAKGTYTRYIDGVSLGADSLTYRLKTWDEEGVASKVFSIGATSAGSALKDCDVDEFRLETVARSAEWIAACCETQAKLGHGVPVSFEDSSLTEPVPGFPAYFVLASRPGDPIVDGVIDDVSAGKAAIYDSASASCIPAEMEFAFGENRKAACIWAKVPSFSKSTKLFVCSSPLKYPSATVQDEGVKSTVWDDKAYLVWHLNQDNDSRKDSVSGTVLHPAKSSETSQVMYAPATDGPTGPNLAARMGPYSHLRSSPSAYSWSFNGAYTVSFWLRKDDFDSPKGEGYAMQLYSASNNKQMGLLTGYASLAPAGKSATNRLWLWQNLSTPNSCAASAVVPDAGWHHYAFTGDGVLAKAYVDGQEVDSVSSSWAPPYPTSAMGSLEVNVGCTRTTYVFPGAFDEVRFEGVARSADWILASYETQRAWMDGVWRTEIPAFGCKSTVSAAPSGMDFSVQLVCRRKADVAFYWGVSDAGEDSSGWEHELDLGCLDEGEVVAKLTGLAFGQRIVGRFAASNDNSKSKVWSGLVSGRTGASEVPSEGWRYQTITMNWDGEELHDFPFCVRLPASKLLPQDPSCLNIRCVDGGAQVPFEVETWNPTGVSVLWVRAPVLAKGNDFVLEWKKSSSGAQWPSSAIWNDEFGRVYHFGPKDADSSCRMANIISRNGVSDVEGVVGQACGFSGAGSASTGSARLMDFSKGFTLSLWAKISSAGACTLLDNVSAIAPRAGTGYSFDRQVIRVEYGNDAYLANSIHLNVNALLLADGSQSWAIEHFKKCAGMALPDNDWHQYVWVHDGCGLKTYCDGVLHGESDSVATTMGEVFSDLDEMSQTFGSQSSGAAKLVSGAIDECRIETCPRSSEWIRAAYMDQHKGLVSVGEIHSEGLLLLFK